MKKYIVCLMLVLLPVNPTAFAGDLPLPRSTTDQVGKIAILFESVRDSDGRFRSARPPEFIGTFAAAQTVIEDLVRDRAETFARPGETFKFTVFYMDMQGNILLVSDTGDLRTEVKGEIPSGVFPLSIGVWDPPPLGISEVRLQGPIVDFRSGDEYMYVIASTTGPHQDVQFFTRLGNESEWTLVSVERSSLEKGVSARYRFNNQEPVRLFKAELVK